MMASVRAVPQEEEVVHPIKKGSTSKSLDPIRVSLSH